MVSIRLLDNKLLVKIIWSSQQNYQMCGIKLLDSKNYLLTCIKLLSHKNKVNVYFNLWGIEIFAAFTSERFR